MQRRRRDSVSSRKQSQPSRGTSAFVNNHGRRSLAQPSSDGFPEGLLDQPFYGWVTNPKNNLSP
ncbi:MAG TPA: hypothetical protein VLQ90_13700, partial [Pyrinomonadaceae bacterium]|nr:hypothetical protein [Pyrinomonadaceae bacterium]